MPFSQFAQAERYQYMHGFNSYHECVFRLSSHHYNYNYHYRMIFVAKWYMTHLQQTDGSLIWVAK